jgi:Leucine-rich repeat (LRR) protein
MVRYVICLALAGAGLVSAADPASWISTGGGTLTRNAAGRVTGIDLHASWVTDSDMAELARLGDVTQLDLSLTRIGDRGLQELKSVVNLTDVNLYYAELITDQGLSVVKSWKHLRRINLRGTKATDSTLQFLAGIPSIESLDVGFAQITDIGLNNLSTLFGLKELAVGGNKLTDNGLLALRQMAGLTMLDLSGSQRTDSGLWSVSITESGLDTISTLAELRHLRLNGTAISSRGLEKLTTLGKLERLDLQGCSRITDDAAPVLGAMSALRLVDVTDTQMTAAGVAALRGVRPNLTVLAGPPAK